MSESVCSCLHECVCACLCSCVPGRVCARACACRGEALVLGQGKALIPFPTLPAWTAAPGKPGAPDGQQGHREGEEATYGDHQGGKRKRKRQEEREGEGGGRGRNWPPEAWAAELGRWDSSGPFPVLTGTLEPVTLLKGRVQFLLPPQLPCELAPTQHLPRQVFMPLPPGSRRWMLWSRPCWTHWS